MIGKQWLVAGALVLAAAVAPHATSAASLSPQSTRVTEVDGSLVQKAQYRYCRRWRHECADRWGWRTRGYFRCLARHGC